MLYVFGVISGGGGVGVRGVGVSAVDAGDARELELDMHVSEGRELELKLDVGDV